MLFDGGKITKWTQGEIEFSIRQMNPFKAMKVLGELQKTVLPVIGGAAKGLRDSSEQSEMVEAVAGALSQMATTLDGDKLEKACNLLLDTDYLAFKTKEDKNFKSLDMDDLAAIYTGRPWDLLALCYKIFEVNFLDFSMSCSVPIGIRNAVNEIRRTIMDTVGNTLEE
jgi:hypothetical protein